MPQTRGCTSGLAGAELGAGLGEGAAWTNAAVRRMTRNSILKPILIQQTLLDLHASATRGVQIGVVSGCMILYKSFRSLRKRVV